MIVVMKHDATEKNVTDVLNRIIELGLRPHQSQGEERTIIGVVGVKPGFTEIHDALEVMTGVEEVITVTKPYKLSNRDFHPLNSTINVRGVTIGSNEVVVMAGPCAVESEKQLIDTAIAVRAAGACILRGGAFKPSTSPYNFRGLGKEGLQYLAHAREETGMPVITEVLSTEDVDLVAEYADILQVGARNMQNFPLLDAVGKVQKPVMLKRGLSATVQEWLLAADYILDQGNNDVILCERGIRTFETATRNTMDISSIPLIHKLSHLPVIADPSHGCGKWYLVTPLALASVAAGADGVMIEVHPDPDHALKDGPQSLTFENFGLLMAKMDPVINIMGRKLAQQTAGIK